MTLNNVATGLTARLSTAADLALVQEVCKDARDGDDYVPQSWAYWAADPNNQLYLFEWEGQPAAVYCLRFKIADATSAWVQGVRVATNFKRRGLAAMVIEHAIKVSQAAGYTVLRYITAFENAPMHRLAARYNFKPCGAYSHSNYDIEILPKSIGLPLPSRLVTTSEFDGAYGLIVHSLDYQVGGGYYSDAWHWKLLNLENLRRHIEKGEVFGLNGALRALAMVSQDDSEKDNATYWSLDFLTGEYQAKQALLAALIHKLRATARPTYEFMALIAKTQDNDEILAGAGFVPDKLEPAYALYELKF